MVDHERIVYGGVDTHKEFHVAAAVDDAGRILGTETFPATAAGYRSLERWLERHGTIAKVGVEGTGSYGLGLARALAAREVEVVEVNRPNRQLRRRRGKSDTVDAEAAARAVLNGEATTVPKAADGIVEAIRALRVVFCSTRSTRTRISNQIRDLLVTAPDQLRETLEPLDTDERVARAARFRCNGSELAETTKVALRTLARQHQMLTTDLDALRAKLDELTAQANPALRHAVGIGPDVASILLIAAGDNPERLTTEAGFAALCGASPVEASSGKHVSHRLNKGGNRQANHALWRIAMVRMTCHQPTKDYAARRRSEGKSQRFIIRCLKRYIAREVLQLLLNPATATTTGRDLRADRRQLGHTQEHVANALGCHSARISTLENDRQSSYELRARYREWLDNQIATCAA